MKVIDFDLTKENASIYPDEVALINTYRRVKNQLSTGYGSVHFAIEVVSYFGKFIRTTVEEKAMVDEKAPSFVGAIYNVEGKQEAEV